MRMLSGTSIQRVVQALLAIWLGAVLPLLCVPGVSSNHDHGIHWAWERVGSRHHHHGGANEHRAFAEHAPGTAAGDAEERVSANALPQAERLLALFNLMNVLPPGLAVTCATVWIGVMGPPALARKAPPPVPPWNPPKVMSCP